LGVTAIPALAIINAKTGEFIAGGTARDDVYSFGGDPEKVQEIIAKWKAIEGRPMSDAPQLMDTGAGKRGALSKFLSFFSRNPMIIFGLIYFINKWMRGNDTIETGAAEKSMTTPPVVEEESEF